MRFTYLDTSKASLLLRYMFGCARMRKEKEKEKEKEKKKEWIFVYSDTDNGANSTAIDGNNSKWLILFSAWPREKDMHKGLTVWAQGQSVFTPFDCCAVHFMIYMKHSNRKY